MLKSNFRFKIKWYNKIPSSLKLIFFSDIAIDILILKVGNIKI